MIVGNAREYKRGKYHCIVDLLFDWFGLVCFANKKKIVSFHTADSKTVKQEVYGTVIPPPFSISRQGPEVEHLEGASPG
jgi:hypothetical protein